MEDHDWIDPKSNMICTVDLTQETYFGLTPEFTEYYDDYKDGEYSRCHYEFELIRPVILLEIPTYYKHSGNIDWNNINTAITSFDLNGFTAYDDWPEQWREISLQNPSKYIKFNGELKPTPKTDSTTYTTGEKDKEAYDSHVAARFNTDNLTLSNIETYSFDKTKPYIS